jgi:hypothetical protein
MTSRSHHRDGRVVPPIPVTAAKLVLEPMDSIRDNPLDEGSVLGEEEDVNDSPSEDRELLGN